MAQWFVGEVCLDRKIKKNGKLPLEINIPLFHHSIIPDTRHESMPQQLPINSISCRTSET